MLAADEKRKKCGLKRKNLDTCSGRDYFCLCKERGTDMKTPKIITATTQNTKPGALCGAAKSYGITIEFGGDSTEGAEWAGYYYQHARLGESAAVFEAAEDCARVALEALRNTIADDLEGGAEMEARSRRAVSAMVQSLRDKASAARAQA
jgi:hypothetical protein